MPWLDSWTCRKQTACMCFIWPKKSTRSSLFSMRGYLLFSLVYWKELLQQLLWLLLKMFIPKPELRDQDTSRKLPLCPLARALGSVRKTQFEGSFWTCRSDLLYAASRTCYMGLKDPQFIFPFTPGSCWAPYPGTCWGYSKHSQSKLKNTALVIRTMGFPNWFSVTATSEFK